MDWRSLLVWGLVLFAGCGRSAPAPAVAPSASNGPAKRPTATGSPSAEKPAATDVDSGAGDTRQPVASQPTTSKQALDNASSGTPVSELQRKQARDLASSDSKQRQQATAAFDALGDQANAVALALVGDQQADVRRGALFYLLGRFDAQDDAIVGVFVRALNDDDRSVRAIALQAVRQLPPPAAEQALSQLANMLNDPQEDEANRRLVANLLAGMRTDSTPAVPALARAAVADPSESVRSACVLTLRRIGTAEQVLPVYAQILSQDRSATVRRMTAIQLKQVGVAALPIVETMCDALADQDEQVRRNLTDALISLGSGAVEPVTKRLKSPQASVRQSALFILGKIGPPARSSQDQVRQLLQDEDADVRRLAELVLKRLEEL